MAILVLTTVPDLESAQTLARALVEERLAACVNIGGPITSVYRWKGTVETATEHQLVIKTVSDRVTAVHARVAALHPYELPEFLVLDVAGGDSSYLTWITAQTDGPDSEPAR